jgi:hypothetical protein
MHIQADENSVTLPSLGSVDHGTGSTAYRPGDNMRTAEPADIILVAFVVFLICVLLMIFVF